MTRADVARTRSRGVDRGTRGGGPAVGTAASPRAPPPPPPAHAVSATYPPYPAKLIVKSELRLKADLIARNLKKGAAARLLRRLAQPALRPRLRPAAHRPERGQHRHSAAPAPRRPGAISTGSTSAGPTARSAGSGACSRACCATATSTPRSCRTRASTRTSRTTCSRSSASGCPTRRPRCRTATGSCATATRTAACCSGTATTSAAPTATRCAQALDAYIARMLHTGRTRPSPSRTRGRAAYFEHTIALLNEHGTTPVIVLMPIHPRVLRVMKQHDMGDERERLRDYLAELGETLSIKVLDFTTIRSFNGRADWFYDGVHITRGNANRVIVAARAQGGRVPQVGARGPLDAADAAAGLQHRPRRPPWRDTPGGVRLPRADGRRTDWRTSGGRRRGSGARWSRSWAPCSRTTSPSSPPPSPTTRCSRCCPRSSSSSRCSAWSGSRRTRCTRCSTRVGELGAPWAAEFVSDVLDSVLTSQNSGVVFIVSLVASLWAASAYVGSFMAASDRIYEIERAAAVLDRASRCASALALALLVLLSATAAVDRPWSAPSAAGSRDATGIGTGPLQLWTWIKWPLLIVARPAAVHAAVQVHAQPAPAAALVAAPRRRRRESPSGSRRPPASASTSTTSPRTTACTARSARRWRSSCGPGS